MSPSRIRIARDYNRGLPLPARWVHLGVAAIQDAVEPVARPVNHPARRAWARPLALGLLGLVCFLPLDGPINRLFNPAHYAPPETAPIRLGGDIRREAEFIQQYGQFTATAIAMVLILLLDRDRARRRAIGNWLAGAAATLLLVNIVKMTVGRPRPKFDDPWGFIGPLGRYPVRADDPAFGLRYPWEFWRGISSDLWSMPSSHTAYAVVMSVSLAVMYPRLRVFALVMAVLVGVCRVVLNSHYPSDVVVGATLGYLMATAAHRGRWGERMAGGRSGEGRERAVRELAPAGRKGPGGETGPVAP